MVTPDMNELLSILQGRKVYHVVRSPETRAFLATDFGRCWMRRVTELLHKEAVLEELRTVLADKEKADA